MTIFKPIIKTKYQKHPLPTGNLWGFNAYLTIYYIRLIIVTIFIHGFINISFIHGQSISQDETTSEGMIEELKNGVLVVLLPTYQQKIQTLEEMIQSRAAFEKVSRLEKLLQRTKTERDRFQIDIIEAFNQQYTFSDYVFLADSNYAAFKEGNRRKLHAKSPVFPEKTSGKIFILRRAQLENGADALLICDANLTPIKRPFPYYQRLQSFATIVGSIFSSDSTHWRDLGAVMLKWNEKLHAFYQKS